MASVSIIVVEKGGSIKELKVKTYNEDELYKKAGFKTSSDFTKHTIWKNIKANNTTYNIHVYGKTTGRANQENKYEFPPPIDNTLFFGSCVLVNKIDDIPQHLTSKEWKNIYNELYGGFDDLNGDESEESEDEDENLPKTKSGYVKDDFIVDDDDSYQEESDSLSEKTLPKTRNNKNIPPKTGRMKAPTVFTMSDSEEESDYTNELEEEEYL
tara:strand:+ start:1599 stop:2234 length:636 start_codon:yes stop_codon:yes gene_type:complete